jgi:uncharacterized protein
MSQVTPRPAVQDEFGHLERKTGSSAALVLFFAAGIFFGIVAIRSEISSWYRIYEMFRFQSFHMYGTIGSAVLVGAVSLWLIRKYSVKSLDGEKIVIEPREPGVYRYLLGGTLFGLGWGLVGVCPGPIYALLGSGYAGALAIFGGALLGTYLYGMVYKKLPH